MTLPRKACRASRRLSAPGSIRASEWGEEFVYPKARAIVLAKETNTPVLFVPDTVTPEVAVAIKTPDNPVVVQLAQAPVMAVQPSGQQVEIAQVVTQPVLVAQNDPAPAAALPATGSSLPLVALFGMLALAGALTVGFLQKRAVL